MGAHARNTPETIFVSRALGNEKSASRRNRLFGGNWLSVQHEAQAFAGKIVGPHLGDRYRHLVTAHRVVRRPRPAARSHHGAGGVFITSHGGRRSGAVTANAAANIVSLPDAN